MYSVTASRDFQKSYANLKGNPKIRGAWGDTAARLMSDPFAAGLSTHPVKGSRGDVFASDVGGRKGYRVIWEFDRQNHVVILRDLAPHDEAYERGTRLRPTPSQGDIAVSDGDSEFGAVGLLFSGWTDDQLLGEGLEPDEVALIRSVTTSEDLLAVMPQMRRAATLLVIDLYNAAASPAGVGHTFGAGPGAALGLRLVGSPAGAAHITSALFALPPLPLLTAGLHKVLRGLLRPRRGVTLVPPPHPQSDRLRAAVRRTCQRAGHAPLAARLVVDPRRYCFVWQVSAQPQVCLSSGLVEICTDAELEALVAHELGHLIRHTRWSSVTSFAWDARYVFLFLTVAVAVADDERSRPSRVGRAVAAVTIWMGARGGFESLLQLRERSADTFALDLGVAPADLRHARDLIDSERPPRRPLLVRLVNPIGDPRTHGRY